MGASKPAAHSERVLILAPFGRDAKLIADVLAHAGVESGICANLEDLARRIQEHPGAVVVADEALNRASVEELTRVVSAQPNWSDLPILVLTSGGDVSLGNRGRLQLLEPIGNVTFLERPLRSPTLQSAVASALRARRRQYEIADYLEERERLLDRLRESEALYRGIGESIDFGVWVCTPEGNNTYASDSFLKLVGLTQQQCSGLGWVQALHPDDAERTTRAWRECVRTGGLWNIVHRIRGADGAWHPILARGVPIRNENGEIRCWAGINLDISREQETEIALRDSNEALRRVNADLEQFAYAASHDLQEPLRNVSLYSQLLNKRYAGKLGEDADEFIGTIVGSSRRMEMLIKDLLAYTRATSIHEDVSEPVDSGAVLRKVLSDLETLINETGACVNFGELPELHVHEVHVHQLFQNLIGNALKYRGEAPPVIRIEAARDGACWDFAVADNGIGIDPKYVRQIFGLFKRLHTSAEYEGTGIGLAMYQKIVERYGGRIWVDSELRRGSVFRFTLPA